MHYYEVCLHAAVVIIAGMFLLIEGHQFSRQFESGQQWDGFAPGVQLGCFGKRVDLSDIQWRQFRSGLPAMMLFFFLMAAASHMLQQLGFGHVVRAVFYLKFGALFLSYLHGVHVCFVLLLALFNFYITRFAAGRRNGAMYIWICNLGLLLISRIFSTFPLPSSHSGSFANIFSIRGVFRWDVCFNLTLLRMLSFSMDLHWRSKQQQHPDNHVGLVMVSTEQRRQGICKSARHDRQVKTLPSSADYNLLIYLAYIFYPPLYLAGPVITFQDFAWQLRCPPRLPVRSVAKYAMRFAADWLSLELVTHLFYFNSIAKHRVGLRYQQHGLQFGPVEMGMTTFWVLCFMWLKFATIWRFFRLLALLDGIDPPENMLKCFANNYDIEGFWRGWHSSFNQWLVRYIYIPLGGARYRHIVIWPIFLFVALWHDLEWRMISWAGLVCIAFCTEMFAKQCLHSPLFDDWRQTQGFRMWCAGGAACNIIALMAANLAGFMLGLEGLKGFFLMVVESPKLIICAFVTFFSAANLMFWLQDHAA